MLSRKLLSMLLFSTLSLVATVATASTYGFDRITSNSTTNVASQLSLDVTQSGSNVLFTIFNNGPTASVVDGVYFDFGTTNFFATPGGINWSASNSTTWNSVTKTGVQYSNGGNPSNLPAGNTVGFSADDWGVATAPGTKTGAGPNEYIGFLGTFASGNYNLLLSALDSGNFRVGLHVLSIAPDNTSDSFINKSAPSAVPLPATLPLMLSGLGILGFAARRRKEKV